MAVDKAEYMRKWRKEHKDKVNEYARTYCQKHKDQVNEYQKMWRDQNKEKVKLHNDNYYERNKELVVERRKKQRNDRIKKKWVLYYENAKKRKRVT